MFRESRGRYGYRRVKAALGTGTSPNAEPARHDAGSGPPPRCVPTSVPRSHGGRGCHYRWPGWLDRMSRYGLVRSMGAKGRSPDNAAAEGFFGRMKTRVRVSPGIGRSVRARRPAASPASTSAGTTIRGSNSRWDGKPGRIQNKPGAGHIGKQLQENVRSPFTKSGRNDEDDE